ncbi:uncharacterized protein TRUGW13939_08797, partial [Talaromyces rugulosus]
TSVSVAPVATTGTTPHPTLPRTTTPSPSLQNSATSVAVFQSAIASPSVGGQPDGFPNPSVPQLQSIEDQAHGLLIEMEPPHAISQDSLTSLQLMASSELLKVTFFSDLLTNTTNRIEGYEIAESHRQSRLIDALITIRSQEELHGLYANRLLQYSGKNAVSPCSYSFPVSALADAITLGSMLTSINMATLQDVAQRFAKNGDIWLIPIVMSILGQEAEQEGFYRLVEGKLPSELPFLTGGQRDLAFSAIQQYIVPGSCPGQETISLRKFEALELLSQPVAETSIIQLRFTSTASTPKNLTATFINQQNRPVTEPITIRQVNNMEATAEVVFPYGTNEMNGLTILTLTRTMGPFENIDAVVDATVFGPAFIVVE